MKILIIAECVATSLSPLTANAVEASKSFGATCDILLLGSKLEEATNTATSLPNVANCLIADLPALAHPIAEAYAPIIADIAKDYEVVLMSSSTQSKDLLPRIAGLLRTTPLTDVIEIIDEDTFKRPIYAGNAIQTVRYKAKTKLISIRPTAFKPQSDTSKNKASIAKINVKPPSIKTKWLKMDAPKSERPELTAANIVVSGGRGVGSQDNFKRIEALADLLGAAVGASRAAVDAGYVPNDYQVGQTGKIIAPDVYLCFGISGAIQHLAGMKESQIIIAIDKDPDAAIFKVADYGYVGDLFEVIDRIHESMSDA